MTKEDSARLTEGTGDLRNVFNYAMPQAKELNASGRGTFDYGLGTARSGTAVMTDPLSYYQTLLKGNRTQTGQLLAPETNALQQQSDASRRQQSSIGTARGGGVASTTQDAKTHEMAQIDNAIFGARPGAAAAIPQIGDAITTTGLNTAQLGNQQLQQALGYLNLGAGAGSAIADIGLKRMNGSPGPLSPSGQATSAGGAAAQGGMDLANILIGKLWPKASAGNV